MSGPAADSAPAPALRRGGRPVETSRPSRREGERGAAMVEFVLIIPVFLMLIFGGITAGLAYEHKAEVVHAVRDGARYGATVPYRQCDNTASCGGRNWAQLVQYVTAQRSAGALSASQICVALVSGTDGALFVHPGGVYSTGTNATFPTAGCFNDGNVDSGTRVHVSAVRGGDKINLVLGSIPVTLSSHGVARYEQP
jgi:Flp pilus assembly protein TadG